MDQVAETRDKALDSTTFAETVWSGLHVASVCSGEETSDDSMWSMI